jgi:hypothetical protein
MTTMSAANAAFRPTPAEATAVRAWMQSKSASAEVISLGHPVRAPLGLRPAPGRPDDDAHETSAKPSAPNVWAPQPGRVAQFDELMELTKASGEIVEAMDQAFGRAETKLAEMQGRFDNEIGALRNENQSLRLILEHLRITERGERGCDGDRGAPGVAGRDGVGLAGPAGPRGERGLPAARIVSWDTDLVRFTVTPLLSNGNKAATLPLKELLVAFADMLSAEDEG